MWKRKMKDTVKGMRTGKEIEENRQKKQRSRMKRKAIHTRKKEREVMTTAGRGNVGRERIYLFTFYHYKPRFEVFNMLRNRIRETRINRFKNKTQNEQMRQNG